MVRRFLWSLLAALVVEVVLIIAQIVRAGARARGGGAYWLSFSPLKVLVSIIIIAVVLVVVSLLFEWLYSWTSR